MKKVIIFLLHIHISISIVFFAVACNVLEAAPTNNPTSTPKDTIDITVEAVERASNTPTETTKPGETPVQVTPTPLPTFVQPPTPVPPSEVWLMYTYEDTGLSFQYPANWHVYVESYIYITNFRLDALPLKGHDDEKLKIDITITPLEITDFPSLTAYLDASVDDPGKIIDQIELVHEVDGYEVIRQTRSGLMGHADQTYEVIYVASRGKLIQMVVYGKRYVNVADRIAGTLIIP